MELVLNRTYYAGGTNGQLLLEGAKVSFTIELSWKDNPAADFVHTGRPVFAHQFPF